jgi:hypothetical protein
MAVWANREDVIVDLLKRGVSPNSLSFEEPLIALSISQGCWQSSGTFPSEHRLCEPKSHAELYDREA